MKAIVWSKPACGYCVKAKRLLESKGIEVEEKNIAQGHKVEDLLEALAGLTVLPGKHWKDKCFQLHPDNSKVLSSIARQVFKGSALTEKLLWSNSPA